MFSHSNASTSRPRSAPAHNNTSTDTLDASTSTTLLAPSANSTTTSNSESHRKSRFGLPRSTSPDPYSKPSTSTTVSTAASTTTSTNNNNTTTKSDDLTQMLSRASNYMTLAYVQIPSVVLCLSYKGKGTRNVEDVHNLVFRMPSLEYRNKTWSNLDLALALKKDVIRALISHTGAIIGNKLTHHKPGKHAQSRLRELASSSVLLGGSHNNSTSQVDLHYGSGAQSLRGSGSGSMLHGKRSDASLRTSRSYTASAASLPGQYDASFVSRGGNTSTPSPRFSDVTDEDGNVNFDQRRRSGILLGRSDSFASSMSGARAGPAKGPNADRSSTVFPRHGILRSGEKDKDKDKERLISNPLSRSLTRHLTELTHKARGKDKDKDKDKTTTAPATAAAPSAAAMISSPPASAIPALGASANASGTGASVSAPSATHAATASGISSGNANANGSAQKDTLLAVPSAGPAGASGGDGTGEEESRRQSVRHIGKRILNSLPGTTSP